MPDGFDSTLLLLNPTTIEYSVQDSNFVRNVRNTVVLSQTRSHCPPNTLSYLPYSCPPLVYNAGSAVGGSSVMGCQ